MAAPLLRTKLYIPSVQPDPSTVSEAALRTRLVSRPRRLLTGKFLGLGALTLVQYVIWAAIGLLALVVTGRGASQLLSGISLSASELLLVVPYALGRFTRYAGIMAGIGALAPDMESSRTWVFVISLPRVIPIYLWQPIVT